MRSQGRIAAAVVFVAVVALVAVRSFGPFLTKERPNVTATPALTGLFSRTEIPLPAHETACVGPVTFDHASAAAQLVVLARTPRAPALLVEASAPGYRSSTVVKGYPVGADAPIAAALTAPPGNVTGKVCVTPRGREGVALVGTNEGRSLTPATTTVQGKAPKDGSHAALKLLGAEPVSISGQLSRVIDRASAFTGGYVPSWLLWPIAILAAIGIPAGVLIAMLTTPGDPTPGRARQ